MSIAVTIYQMFLLNTGCSLRNHDLLTSLDVLTTGTYRRLPTAIKVRPMDDIYSYLSVSYTQIS